MPVLGPRVISPIPNLFFVINDLPRCWMDDARRESGRRRAAGCDVTTSWKVAVGSRTCGGPVAVWGPLPFPYGAMEVAKTMKGPCDRSIGEIGPDATKRLRWATGSPHSGEFPAEPHHPGLSGWRSLKTLT